MAKKEEKTNAMRLLEQKGAQYRAHHAEMKEALSGVEMARLLGLPEGRVFKTLVTVGRSKAHYVFVIPVAASLHLKKAAAAVGEKSVEMIPQKELLPLTGYVHGGCSPLGMKKPFPTVIDRSAEDFEEIIFSAGRIGYQVELSPAELRKALDFQLADLTE